MKKQKVGDTLLKKSLHIAFVLALGGTGCVQGQGRQRLKNQEPSRYSVATASKPIFRVITLRNGGEMILGGPFSAVRDLCVRVRKEWQLREGAFGGAKAIFVQTSENDCILSMRFEYDRGRDCSATLATYRGMLGQPLELTEEGSSLIAVWRDAFTEFELVASGEGMSRRVYAVLRDVALSRE